MAVKLHQIVALVSGKKTRIQKQFGDANKLLQKDIFTDMTNTYTPLDEADKEIFPPEILRAQAKVSDIVAAVRTSLVDLIDAIATQEKGNTKTSVDVKVGDQVILQGVPVATLFFLEKHLDDVRTFVENIPTMSLDKEWTEDKANGGFQSNIIETFRGKKTQRAIVLYDATDKHPAQTQLIPEDINVGKWRKQFRSYAMTVPEKTAIINRINTLSEAVKFAREEANSIEVEKVQIGEKFLRFVFEGK